MRVKVGDTWFMARDGQPIMIELTPRDKRNISNMVPHATRYAQFTNTDPMGVQDREKWMDEGATNSAGTFKRV